MSASTSPPSPRATRWEWAQTALLMTNLGWTTLANGGYGAPIALVTGWLTGALVVVHCLANLRPRPDVPAIHPAGWMLLPFLIVALANVGWISPVPWLGWRDWLGWAQMIAVFWVVLNGIRARDPRRMVFFALVALGVIGVGLGCYQSFIQPDWRMIGAARGPEFLGRASGSFSIPNSFAGFLLLLMPAVAALTFRRAASAMERVWWGWVGLVLSFGLILTVSRGAWVSLSLALSVWPLLAARGGWRRRAGLALGVLLGLTILVAVIVTKYPKARERFTHLVLDAGEITRPVMWRGAWRLFLDQPALGTGAGSYNVLFERHRPERFRDEPLWAHNEYLNTLSDYGALGGGLFFGAAVLIAIRCGSRAGGGERRPRHHWLGDPAVHAGWGVGVLAFGLQLGLDFHLKIPALALSFGVVSALAVGAVWPAAPRAATPGVAAASAWLAVAALTTASLGFFFSPMLDAEGLRVRARRTIDRLTHVLPGQPDYGRVLPEARDGLLRATSRDSRNGQAWADLSYATASMAHVEPQRSSEFGRQAEEAANRALNTSLVCSEFWIRRGVARDLQGRWADAGNDFGTAVGLAPADALAWYYYADHLSRMSAGREPAEAALDFCLRLDPGNQAGVALRQRLAIKKKAP